MKLEIRKMYFDNLMLPYGNLEFDKSSGIWDIYILSGSLFFNDKEIGSFDNIKYTLRYFNDYFIIDIDDLETTRGFYYFTSDDGDLTDEEEIELSKVILKTITIKSLSQINTKKISKKDHKWNINLETISFQSFNSVRIDNSKIENVKSNCYERTDSNTLFAKRIILSALICYLKNNKVKYKVVS